jgi:hypothetical protein
MSTLTTEQHQSIVNLLNDTPTLAPGLGSRKCPCSVAAINLALSNTLIDTIPECMSVVVGKWIIGVQDAMPKGMRNSQEWRSLLPYAAGTGRELENARTAILVNWSWDEVLPRALVLADKVNLTEMWVKVLAERNYAALVEFRRHLINSPVKAMARRSLLEAVDTFGSAICGDSYSARGGEVANRVAWSARYIGEGLSYDSFWRGVDPCGLLTKLINAEAVITHNKESHA